jgi:hypothetical protein
MRGRWITTAIALVTAIGCDSILGVRDLPRANKPADVGVDSGPINVACVSCEKANAAAERAACAADAACDSLYRCVNACPLGDVMCRDRCEQERASTASGPLYRALDVRRRTSCAADCFGSMGFSAAIDPLCGCLDAHCAKEMQACIQSGVASTKDVGACEHRMACIARQPNPDGIVDCASQFPTSDEETTALLDCMRKNSCVDKATMKACPISDGELSCVQNFVYARSRAERVSFALLVEDVDAKPIVGATVKACSAARCSADCIALATGTTGADGRATLAVPMFDGGFDGCLRVDAGTSEYMITNVMTGRRIHVDERVLSTISLAEVLLSIYAVEAKVDLRTDRGHMIIALHDCLWNRLSRATITVTDSDSDTVLAYLDGATVVPGAMKTTASGVAAVINLKPGKHDVVVTRDGKEVARQTVTILARELTDANIYPLPK